MNVLKRHLDDAPSPVRGRLRRGRLRGGRRRRRKRRRRRRRRPPRASTDDAAAGRREQEPRGGVLPLEIHLRRGDVHDEDDLFLVVVLRGVRRRRRLDRRRRRRRHRRHRRRRRRHPSRPSLRAFRLRERERPHGGSAVERAGRSAVPSFRGGDDRGDALARRARRRPRRRRAATRRRRRRRAAARRRRGAARRGARVAAFVRSFVRVRGEK